ncbi:carbamate kinase [Rubrobacter aplysinae]|uniref:carbamate kinase n=1 Tax=Rubrobacter aplysinae TaxID=909625 RepID=UPI00064BD866|nr:carbamate kinase [Rubrobacter aplysinae]
MKLAVVAIGGNSLIGDGQQGTIQEQEENAFETGRAISGMVQRGWRVVVTHGNGPQVGFILRRSDLAADTLPRLPLDLCGADSQGGLGYIIGNALQRALSAEGLDSSVVSMLTRVVVDGDDPAFEAPSKPIGPFYSKEEAERHRAEEGWTVVEDSNRGYRRTVPSPRPRKIVELGAMRELVKAGYVLVALGGGGIPVTEESPGDYSGVEAVIDKDYASSLLAAEIGADLLLVSTGVPRVSINYNRPDQREIELMSAEEARAYLEEGQFPPGSMGPKIEAALSFLEAGGPEVIVTSPDSIPEAMDGEAGTRITAEPVRL